MKGKLITIESGSDASGKATQTSMLYERLTKEGMTVKKVEFPDYQSDSSVFVRMYLGGRFGEDPEDIDPYVASPMYTLDRYCSYKDMWEEFYNNGGVVIADRYTTSNMVYQASKIDGREERDRFLDWLWDFEFRIYKLPVPDRVIFLDVPPEVSQRLMEGRANKITGGTKKDIHERDREYLFKTYRNALYVAEKYGWVKIRCYDGKEERLLAVEEIHGKVFERVMEIL